MPTESVTKRHIADASGKGCSRCGQKFDQWGNPWPVGSEVYVNGTDETATPHGKFEDCEPKEKP